MKSYEDLEIYRLSYRLAVTVHALSLKLPQFEHYEEGAQVRRSSKGIPASIVEGYGRKRYKADFIKYLVYAHASCDETICHLNFIKDTHTLVSDEWAGLIDAYNRLGRKLNAFIQYVEREWR